MVVVGLGGPANGVPREDRVDIVVAAKVLAIFPLAANLQDLAHCLNTIVAAYTLKRQPILARPQAADGR